MNIKNVDGFNTELYLDSNIFLNVWFEEMIKFGEIFSSSKRLLEEVTECKFHLVISELTFSELSQKTELPKEVIFDEFFKIYQVLKKLKIVKISKKVADDAIYFGSSYGIHAADALHAMMAKSNKCVLVTRDIELRFAALKYGLDVVRPEEII